MILRLVLFLLLAFSTELISQLSEDSELSLVTCRPGDELFNCWGHTAIWVHDKPRGIDDIYNYGIYSFEEPNFYLKFLQGKLLYLIGKQNPDRFLTNYAYQNRSVFVQKLDLTLSQKNELSAALIKNYRPENRKYLYDFFFDNCSTRPRDLFKKSVMGLTYPDEPETKLTFREMINQYTTDHPWADFGIDLIIGSKADKRANVSQQMFLPEYLMHTLNKSSNGHKPLVKETVLALDFESKVDKRNKRPWFNPNLFFGILLLLELFNFIQSFRSKAYSKWLKIYDKIWYFILGLSSFILLFMWFGTDHKVTKANFNILWANPLFLMFTFSNKWIYKRAILLFLGLALLAACFFQEFHSSVLLIICITILKVLREIIVEPQKA